MTGNSIVLRELTVANRDAYRQLFSVVFNDFYLFERLIGISGIGPKLAIAVLSGIDPRDLLLSVQRGDVARLTGIPGIGKKTAERIVLELKDRLAQIAVAPALAGEAAPADADRLRLDLLSALQNLGYHRPQAEKAIDTTLHAMSDATFERALKSALRELLR